MRLGPHLRFIVLATAAVSWSAPIIRAQGIAVAGEGGGAAAAAREAPAPRPRMLSAAAARTWVKLGAPVAFPFENETSLAEVFKYIRQASAGPNESGIPIYVDPVALRENDVTLASTVTLNIEGVPLATSLGLMLKQHNLTFGVQKDGLLVIGTEASIPEADAALVTGAQAKTWIGLDKRVDVPFAKAASLTDLVKFLGESTRAKEKEGDAGLPVYVDPVSLSEHDLTADSPSLTLSIQGVPLSTALRLMLAQMDLVFRVEKDGIIVVRSADAVAEDQEDAEPIARAAVDTLKREVARLRSEFRVPRGAAGQQGN